MIVALDGPAGSGKSTTARRVADRLGWLYLDTGAMYRAVGLAFGDQSLPFTERAAAALVPGLAIGLVPAPDGVHVSLGDQDVTARIRTPEAAEAASRVSALGPVRTAMVAQQRAVAAAHEATGHGVVVEGRDIGTVVFPGAAVKFFLTADLDARARRRLDDLAVLSERNRGRRSGVRDGPCRDGRARRARHLARPSRRSSLRPTLPCSTRPR